MIRNKLLNSTALNKHTEYIVTANFLLGSFNNNLDSISRLLTYPNLIKEIDKFAEIVKDGLNVEKQLNNLPRDIIIYGD